MLRNPDVMPVEEIPLVEVQTPEELQERLAEIMATDVPGFIIRASGLVDAPDDSHEARVGNIADALNALDRTTEDSAREPWKGAKATNEWEGSERDAVTTIPYIHDDDNGLGGVIVHTTEAGTGRVRLANSGHSPDSFRFDTSDSDLYRPMISKQQVKLNKRLNKGKVDTRVMERTLHTADLKEGDTVVMRTRNHKGPVFHQFTSPPYKRRRAVSTNVDRRDAAPLD